MADYTEARKQIVLDPISPTGCMLVNSSSASVQLPSSSSSSSLTSNANANTLLPTTTTTTTTTTTARTMDWISVDNQQTSSSSSQQPLYLSITENGMLLVCRQ